MVETFLEIFLKAPRPNRHFRTVQWTAQPNFEDSQLRVESVCINGLYWPTGIEFAPSSDGRVFIIEKDGKVKVKSRHLAHHITVSLVPVLLALAAYKKSFPFFFP
eukprot:jgi/Mesvir1/13152/Mv06121-RA.1